MDATELLKLRRFALATALLFATYQLAGITVGNEVKAFGFSVQIARPELLPLGFALAATYAALRYYYYGHMLTTSPHRKRRDLLDRLRRGDDTKTPIPMYWGPRELFSVWNSDEAYVREDAKALKEAFPRFAGGRVRTKVTKSTDFNEEGNEYDVYRVHALIPRRCRAAAIFEAVDYSSPVWLNAFALLGYAWTLLRTGQAA